MFKAVFPPILFLTFFCGTAVAQVTQITTTTGPTGTVTQTQTTAVEGPAAAKAQADAQTAQAQALSAALPGSGINPSTSMSGNNAGYEEVSLLTAVAIKAAAYHITRDALKDHKGALVVVGGNAMPDTSAWLMFQARSSQLLQAFGDDSKAIKDVLAAKKSRHEEYAFGIEILAAQKALSYLYTSYQAAGINMPVDDYLMTVALIEFAPDWDLLSQHFESKVPDDVDRTLAKLRDAAQSANDLVVSATQQQAVLATAKDPRADLVKSRVAILAGDLSSLSSFLNTLSGSANGSAGGMASVLAARAFSRALSCPPPDDASESLAEKLAKFSSDGKETTEEPEPCGTGIVFIKVATVGGGFMTKSNLWTNLGAMPLYASVGLVVSYVYYPGKDASGKQSAQKTAGVFEVATAYHTVGKVLTALRLDSSGDCAKSDRPDGSDAAKYCPIVFPAPH